MVKGRVMDGSAFDTPYRGGFVGAAHHYALSVYFEDTDTAQIVYYANYLKYMERARSDMLRAVGIDQRAAMEAGKGVYAVADVAIRYRASARLGDDLLVVSTIDTVRAATVAIHQRVMRGPDLLTDAQVTAAFLSPDGRPRRQPREWLDAFRAIKAKGTI
jgi:acyl-CoA thioester hydrolase